jgi:hypothetical protein
MPDNNPNFQAGQIGGFFIGPEYLIDTANSMGMSSILTNADDVRFWAGDSFDNRASAPFRVTRAGLLYATGATISGPIASTTGTIGGFTIGATALTAGTGPNSISLSSTGLSWFGVNAAGEYYTQISSGYNGSGGSFVSRYDTKNLLVLNTHPSGSQCGEISLYDSAEVRNVFLSGTGTITTIFLTTTAQTVGALPSASGRTGARAFVTDALVSLSIGIGAVVTGGGGNASPVYCDGTDWRQG